MVVVKWLACSPSTPTIPVWITLNFFCKIVFEKNENIKRSGLAHLLKNIDFILLIKIKIKFYNYENKQNYKNELVLFWTSLKTSVLRII